TEPLQEALIEMSGTPRRRPVTAATAPWYAGRAKNTDRPPPAASGLGCGEPVNVRWVARLNESFHTVSGRSRWPLGPSFRRVPPTPVTSGSLSGQEVTR